MGRRRDSRLHQAILLFPRWSGLVRAGLGGFFTAPLSGRNFGLDEDKS